MMDTRAILPVSLLALGAFVIGVGTQSFLIGAGAFILACNTVLLSRLR